MIEIPEDIREEARAIARNIGGAFSSDYYIARAILAERERCLHLVLGHKATDSSLNDALGAIGAAIRTPSTGEET